MGSTIAAGLVVVGAPFLTFVPAAGLLALVLLGLARVAAKYAYLPVTITSIGLVSLAFITAFAILVARSVFETGPLGSPWLALVSLLLVTAFYGAAAYLWQSKWFTYLGLASALSAIAGLLLLVEAPAIVFVLAGGLLALILIGLE